MSERNITLLITEDSGRWANRHAFVISISDSGVEIRRAGEPIASRDRSVSTTVGREPHFTDLVLHVEESP